MLDVIISIIVSVVVCIPVGFVLGMTYRKKVGEAEIGSAEEQARSSRKVSAPLRARKRKLS